MAGSGATPCGVPGLEAVLVEAGLEHHIGAANAWCEQMGARFLSELAEEDVMPEFIEALKLKPLESRRLKKAFAATSPATSAPAVAQAPPLAPAPALPPAKTLARQYFVKNTFLDINDDARPAELARANTVPSHSTLHAVDEDDDYDAEDDEEDDIDVAGTPPATTPGVKDELPGLYKTVTLDGYESCDEWAWANLARDPVHEAAPVAMSSMVPSAAVPSDSSMGYGDPTWGQGAMSAPVGYGGMIMIPTADQNQTMMPQPVAGSWAPGCMMYPISDRFMRWPMGVDGDNDINSFEWSAAADKEHSSKNVLERAFSVQSTIYRVRWTVDARKLKSKDTEAVSPAFKFIEGNDFKMLIRPRVTSETKGGASFKKARGRGVVELRCLDDVDPEKTPVVTFRISIGSPADPRKQQLPRGPVRHDFSQKSTCGLKHGEDEWNFSQVVDKTTQTFVVVLEVLSGLPGNASE